MSALFDRRLTPARPDLAAAFLEGKVKAERYVVGEAFHVIAAHAPLRPRPDAACPLDSEVIRGEDFMVYEDRKDGWVWGQLRSDGYVGYVPRAALARGPAPAASHVVAVPRSHLYPVPDLKHPPVTSVTMGAPLAVTGATVDGRWLELDGGRYIFAGHAAEATALARDPVATAEAFLGTPYLWGGRTAEGIDCSGLVQVALTQAGLPCPRDSDMQASFGEPVAPGQPVLRGDLLCYRGHVALSRGDGTVVHATAAVMAVTIEPREALEARVRTEGGIAPGAPATIAVRRFKLP